MPEMDGYTASSRIREDEKGQNTKIVVITASAMKEHHERALKSGCDDLVKKPIAPQNLPDHRTTTRY